FDLAGLHLDRAVELNPMDVRITSMRALWLIYVGKVDDALRSFDADVRRDPFPPQYFWAIRGAALFQAGRYEGAIQALSRGNGARLWICLYLASAHAYLGLIDEARGYGGEVLRMRPAFTLGQVGTIEIYKDPRDLDHLLDGLRKAGLPD